MLYKIMYSIVVVTLFSCGGHSPNMEDEDTDTDRETGGVDSSSEDNWDTLDSASDFESDSNIEDDVPVPQSCIGEVIFPDKALESAVRELLCRYFSDCTDSYVGPLTGELLSTTITTATPINKPDSGIRSLKGIECLTSMESVNLAYNNIIDLTPLTFMPKLKELGLVECNLSDLSQLEKISTLTALEVANNPIEDFKFLNNMSEMSYLYIDNTGLESIEFIKYMPKLVLFKASYNNISDLTPFSVLNKPMTVYLDYNRIENIEPVRSLVGPNNAIGHLSLSNNMISDISVLDGVHFYNLALDNNQIEDISALWGIGYEFTDSSGIYLHNNKIKDISPLLNLGNTREGFVTLHNNRIEDISPLVEILKKQGMSPQQLNLNGNEISDLSPLAELDFIGELGIANNKVSDISFLSEIQFYSLYAANNQIHDLSPFIHKADESWTFDFMNNRVTSVAPLVALGRKGTSYSPNTLILAGNPLDDIALKEDMPVLCETKSSRVYFGDGEVCDWMSADDYPVSGYNYPPIPFEGEEPLQPQNCEATSDWLADASLPSLSRAASEFEILAGDSSEATVLDLITGLTWRRCSIGQVFENGACTGTATTFADLESGAASCNGAFGGIDNWRLPTPSELATLIDYEIHYPGPTINAEVFPGTFTGTYLTSMSPLFRVSFYSGAITAKGSDSKVRCVSGASPQADIETRFVIDEATVLDTWTNLEWQRCALGQNYQEGSCIGNGERVTRSDAQSVCTGDWRLPTVIELSSIVNPCGFTPSAYSEAFPNTPPTDFWTNTLFPDDDEKNWTVYFTTGWVEPTLHTGFARVRCVR